MEEFIHSDTANRLEIFNLPLEVERENIIHLVLTILQPARDNWPNNIMDINSGYRSPELNVAIGGSTTSQHCKGEAADVELRGVDNKELATWIKDNCEFDQLILEYYDDGVTNSGWVHVSKKKEGNRKQLLTAQKDGKKTVYTRVYSF